MPTAILHIMEYMTFLAQVVLISFSGVMAPGPMTAVVMGKGAKSPHAGALVSIGHGIIEVPLIGLLILGLGKLVQIPRVETSIGIVGGVVLLWMGIGMFRSINTGSVQGAEDTHSPVLAGIITSGSNPYFLIWWATIGMTLIVRSVEFGALGVVVFTVVHWLCDFVWFYFLSFLSYKGGQFFGHTFQKVVFAVCGAVLVVFGIRFGYHAIVSLIAG